MALTTSRVRRALLDLGPLIYPERVPLDDFRMLEMGPQTAPGEMPIPEAGTPGWRPMTVGMRWGAPDNTAWFHGEARVPERWISLTLPTQASETAPPYAVALRLLLGRGGQPDSFGWPEGLLYLNGRLHQGINRHHQDVLIPTADVRTGALRFDVRAWSGLVATDHRIEEAEIALLDRDTEALLHLLTAGADVVDALDERDTLAHPLLAALESAADAVIPVPVGSEPAAATSSALAALHAHLAALREQHQPRSRPTVVALGHGHLDVAWLWQTRHTREKTARTFGIATALMEHYPDYRFLHTTPQVFVWLRADYPTLYQRVVDRAREGRFEVAGAMWVESDCNLASGESLVRQILYAQRFLREEFGRESDVLWLPDAFGYSAALPQIMLRAGLRTFVTTKMSWSETNRIPHDTFRWRGLDGSEVLAHFITTPNQTTDPRWMKMDTYNGALSVAAVRGVWDRYRQKALNDEVLLAFGFGDGGAGPTRQHLERARAIRELPGVPALQLGRADESLARLRQRVWSNPQLPSWDGELYLEYHRGTYTTQAWLKRAHRQAEASLLLAELLDAWNAVAANFTTHPSPPAPAAPSSAAHPPTSLDDAWRTLLLHEFHDILPGSSIHEVYRDARESFARLGITLHSAIERGLSDLARLASVPSGSALVFNPSPFPTTAVVVLPGAPTSAWADPADPSGAPLVAQPITQPIANQAEQSTLALVPDLPPLGYRILTPHSPANGASSPTPGENSAQREPARAKGFILENAYFRLALDDHGEIASLRDKRVPGGREVFLEGRPGNQLILFDDRPEAFDAWNIDATYEARAFPLAPAEEITVRETGPLRATIRIVRRLGRAGASTLTQDISLYRDIPRIDFVTHIDWHERHALLKAAFPLDLRTTIATYEVQYGAVERATHRNTSWDAARFEVWAHRWVDLSEAGYGVSLLNDGRYGHDVHDSTVRISLLRGPTYPDPRADLGEHTVTYSLFPHLGDWRSGETVAAAYALNRPVRMLHIPDSHGAEPGQNATLQVRPQNSLFSASPAAVVVEAVKRAADGDGLIVRLYEVHGARHTASIRSSIPLVGIEECDLLERPLTREGSPAYDAWHASPAASHDTPTWDAAGWTCALRPFEVRTFRLRVRP